MRTLESPAVRNSDIMDVGGTIPYVETLTGDAGVSSSGDMGPAPIRTGQDG